MWMHGDMGWGWMVAGWVWMTLFWASIVGVVVWAISRVTAGSKAFSMTAPLEIAKARYARGEITQEQFETLRKDLG